MRLSIIIPSFNQVDYIQDTLENIVGLKKVCLEMNIELEVLLFDSESDEKVQEIINKYKNSIDYLEIKKDKGQYDAINKGIQKCTGEYWTWLNTDDLLDTGGFKKTIAQLRADASIDYIYGGIEYIDQNGQALKTIKAWELDFHKLVSVDPAIFQPGSFFKTTFTQSIGFLDSYKCCFDYEYILRCMKNDAKIFRCDYTVSKFRYYALSKTGSIVPQFIREQLQISELYGRKWYHYFTFFQHLRLMKHKLFPR